MSNVVFAPVSEPQSKFLTSTSWLTIYGGAAFSGKSYCALGSVLPLIQYPGTRALCIRKTTKQLSGSGGLFDAAIDLYSKVDPKLKVKARDLILKFSTGAELQFTYLDKPADRLNLQGKEFSRIIFDEAQQLTGDNVFYALSRLRSTKVPYPLQASVTCNPDPDSWLMPFVHHSLDDELVPIRSLCEKERYFVRDSAGLHFFDNKEDAIAIHGISKESPIRDMLFVPADIYDNPEGLRTNQSYISTLKALPRTEMLRLLKGAWVREQKSGFFKRDWVKFVNSPNISARKRVRSWDIASSEESEANPRVDATAGVLMSKSKESLYTVEHVVLLRKRIHEVEKTIIETAYSDGFDVTISLPLDPGATAGAYSRGLAKQLSERGFSVKLIKPERGKIQRFLPFASVAEAGFVNIVRGEWTEKYVDELEGTEFSKKTHDDQADATSDAFYTLNRNISLPDFHLPDMTSTSQFDFSYN